MPDPEPTSADQQAAEDLQKILVVQARILERLQARGHTGVCAMCGSNTWQMGSYVTLGTSTNPGQISIGGAAYPFIVIFCTTCGNTHFVNLFNLGFTNEDMASLAYPPIRNPPPPFPKPSG